MTLPSELFHKPVFYPWAEYKRVKALYDAYPLKSDDKTACNKHTDEIIESLSNVVGPLPEPPSESFLQKVYSTIYGLYELEDLYASPPMEPSEDLTSYRQYLGRKAREFSLE